MSIEKLIENLNKQIENNTAPPHYQTLYYIDEYQMMKTRLYIPGITHKCGIKECPSNG